MYAILIWSLFVGFLSRFVVGVRTLDRHGAPRKFGFLETTKKIERFLGDEYEGGLAEGMDPEQNLHMPTLGARDEPVKMNEFTKVHTESSEQLTGDVQSGPSDFSKHPPAFNPPAPETYEKEFPPLNNQPAQQV